ncbi:unnamed protein product [Heligmosomoides polygyrus]|uniref:Secreted protein n=1 Tax=Heligmosomoides polygyrus TaxID=6339 RepID=A0A183F4K0_HELPZ|nr:unnamed protein product [Heligmosomoides polygyrus]
MVRAYSGAATIGLGSLKTAPSDQEGVLSRAELLSPASSPQRHIGSSSMGGGLRSLASTFSSSLSMGDAFSGRGIILRRF